MAVDVSVQSPANSATTPAPVRDFLLEETGEIAVRNGDFAPAAGAAAVPQGIRVRLKMLLGENWLDQTKGTDWLNQILIKSPNPNVVRELLREQVADTPDVTDANVGAIQALPDRAAAVEVEAATVYSSTPLSAQVSAS